MNHLKNEKPTIAVLGLSGRTGLILGRQLLEAGFHVKALVRNSLKVKLKHPNLEVNEGSLFEEENLQKLILDSSVLISVLGYSKNSPPLFQTQILKKLIPMMEKSSCQRIIILTGSGVSNEGDKNTIGNLIISKLIYFFAKTRFKDGVYQLEELKKSSLNWTVFRCPLLINSPKIEENAYVGDQAPGFFNTINRGTVSSLIIKELQIKTHLRRALFAWL